MENRSILNSKTHSCCEVKPEPANACCEHSKKQWVWFKDKLVITVFGIILLLILGLFIPILKPFDASFWNYTRMIWWAILLGIFLGGVMDYYIPQSYISKYLASSHKRTVFYAVGLGFLMSACSHGILALSMELHKKGAAGPAVIGFLLASPWTNLPVTMLLLGFFGIKGVLIIVSALIVALVTGLILQKLEARGMIEKNQHTLVVEEGFSILKDIQKRWSQYHFSLNSLREDIRGVSRGMWELAEMILWWILMGFLLASLIAAYVPPHLFQKFLGPSLMGLLITLGFAAVLEVCSEGTAPIAFEIYRQTGAIGNSFVFLMAGVATDYTEVGLVWMNIGKRTALWMVVLCVPQILLLGWIYNLFL